MKVRIRWTYTYVKEDTFEEVVEVANGLTDEQAEAAALEVIHDLGNAGLVTVFEDSPGDPIEEVEWCVRVSSTEPATIP